VVVGDEDMVCKSYEVKCENPFLHVRYWYPWSEHMTLNCFKTRIGNECKVRENFHDGRALVDLSTILDWTFGCEDVAGFRLLFCGRLMDCGQ